VKLNGRTSGTRFFEKMEMRLDWHFLFVWCYCYVSTFQNERFASQMKKKMFICNRRRVTKKKINGKYWWRCFFLSLLWKAKRQESLRNFFESNRRGLPENGVFCGFAWCFFFKRFLRLRRIQNEAIDFPSSSGGATAHNYRSVPRQTNRSFDLFKFK
jgi:hypothetical protein